MNPRARKVHKMVTCVMPLSHHLNSEDSINSINFFSDSQLQYKLCGRINDHYCVALSIHSHAAVGANLGVRIFPILMLIRRNPGFRKSVNPGFRKF